MAAEKRDYYEVLGVDKSASEDEIKRASFAGTAFGRAARAGTVSCATRTSPHPEQRLPSVSPVFVPEGSTAGKTSSTSVC